MEKRKSVSMDAFMGKVFGASLKNSSGLMIFDNCYVDWETFFEQMKIAFSIKKK